MSDKKEPKKPKKPDREVVSYIEESFQKARKKKKEAK